VTISHHSDYFTTTNFSDLSNSFFFKSSFSDLNSYRQLFQIFLQPTEVMAAEEVVAPAVIPVASDHKRKLGDLEPEVLEQAEPSPVDEQEPEVTEKADDVEDGGSPETKRLRIDESKTDGLGN
jgi:hypothetical protein